MYSILDLLWNIDTHVHVQVLTFCEMYDCINFESMAGGHSLIDNFSKTFL